MRSLVLSLVSGAVLAPSLASAQSFYTVNGSDPGYTPVSAITAVPWESLAAGSVVLIHCKDTNCAAHYYEKFAVSDGVTVTGVGNGSALPVIDGNGAVSRRASGYTVYNQDRGVVQISRTGELTPHGVMIQNLEVIGGLSGNRFTDTTGKSTRYASNAAGIYVMHGTNVTISNCTIHGNSNGIFVSSGISSTADAANATRNVLIEKNYVYGNGNRNSDQQHNAYTEAVGITYQYNHMGPLASNSNGNNIKDRSAGTNIRYNWIEGGVRELDLVDTNYLQYVTGYGVDFVYGNLIMEVSNDANRQIMMWGGDSGTTTKYRGAAALGSTALSFYDNTVVSKRTDATAIFRFPANEQHGDVRNCIFYAAQGSLAMLESYGNLVMTDNWMPSKTVDMFSPVGGSVSYLNKFTDRGVAPPVFMDVTTDDYRLAQSMSGVVTDTVLSGLPQVNQEYVKHQSFESRTSLADLGAWQVPGNTATGQSKHK